MRFLSKQKQIERRHVRKIMTCKKGTYSFQTYLTIFTGCVSLRNLEGLVPNSIGKSSLIDKQSMIISTAIQRLVYPTLIDVEGWKKVNV